MSDPTDLSDPDRKSIADLIEIMARLRTPGSGCPWDLEQDFSTIAPYTIEEAYEVADAIERGDMADLKGELGDLLFQVVYHSRLAQEAGSFEFDDVVDGITRKMVRRHPHIFGDEATKSSLEVSGLWERIKAEERAGKPQSATTGEDASLLADVPLPLPALSRAHKLQKRAARVGFDWPDVRGVLDKLREELAEVESELGQGRRDELSEEIGDLIFSVVNLARHADIDPEQALRDGNAKFSRRFRAMEQMARGEGVDLASLDAGEMDAMWRRVKAGESKP